MSDPIIDTTRVSEKGQVVIPKEVRDKLGLKTGMKLIIIATNDTVILQRVELAGEKMRIRDLVERAKSLAERLGLFKT